MVPTLWDPSPQTPDLDAVGFASWGLRASVLQMLGMSLGGNGPKRTHVDGGWNMDVKLFQSTATERRALKTPKIRESAYFRLSAKGPAPHAHACAFLCIPAYKVAAPFSDNLSCIKWYQTTRLVKA